MNKKNYLKRQLCAKINKCKSEEELEGWLKTFEYYPILKDDQDWDYGFFIDLIEFKLKRMRDYFWTHNIVVDEKYYGDICDKLIKILYAGYKTNIVLSSDLKTYVNDKNAYRFFNEFELDFLQRPSLKEYFLATLRETKAKKLFWKYLSNKIELLWD